MTSRANLEQIFTDSKLNNIYINLDNNYCTTSKRDLVFHKDIIGIIYASSQQCIKKIIQNIDDEGRADVCWMYSGINLNNTGCILNQVFRENGYHTVWNGYDNKISTVIEEQDLPIEFLKKWYENIRSENLELGIDILDTCKQVYNIEDISDKDISDKDISDKDISDKDREDEIICFT